MLLYIQYQ